MTTPASKAPNPLVSVERQFETDITTGQTEVRMFVKMYFEARDSGLLADIGDRRWRTLCCLATYMDAQGICNPSQVRIAKDLGVQRQRVTERIRELLQYRFQDRPVIRIEKRRLMTANGERWASNVYQILPIASLRIFDKQVRRKPVSGNPVTGNLAPTSGNPVIGHRPMTGKPVTGNPVINKNQVSNQNTHTVCDGEGDEARRLVSAFHAKRGAPNTRPTARELSQARSLIASHGPHTAAYIVEYAVAAASRTNFQMRHLGAVLSYTDEALADLKRQTQKRIREEHKRRADALEAQRLEYERWRETEAQRIAATLPEESLVELRRIVSEEILTRSQGKTPPGFETLLRIELMRVIAKEHSLPTFEDWRVSDIEAHESIVSRVVAS